jgi:hypothetical protein
MSETGSSIDNKKWLANLLDHQSRLNKFSSYCKEKFLKSTLKYKLGEPYYMISPNPNEPDIKFRIP